VWLPREMMLQQVLRVDVGGGRECFAEVGDEKASTDCAQGWPWDTMRDNRTCKTRDLEGRRTESDDAGVPFYRQEWEAANHRGWQEV
jgi:hypothetical protein